MRFFKLLFVIAIGVSGYNYWQRHQTETASLATISAHGFVPLPEIEVERPSSIVVLAAQNCPEDAAQRADRLVKDLSRKGLPAMRGNTITINIPNGRENDIEKINKVMQGELPIVVVRGKAKANPTLEEVIAEFKGSAW